MIVSRNVGLYSGYFIILLTVNMTYKYLLNKNNKIEYFFFVNDKIKYKTLKYCTILTNIVMFIYLRFVLTNLLNSYNTIKWSRN
uniref:Uncharacterized protein n=1 Tax=Pyramimonas orientalis virus TaxID=455367 RepID=A0A7L9AYS0_POV01|nr:hypothetical protein HWQ62_00263 [Pyramimonas orientalis virus]